MIPLNPNTPLLEFISLTRISFPYSDVSPTRGSLILHHVQHVLHHMHFEKTWTKEYCSSVVKMCVVLLFKIHLTCNLGTQMILSY